MVHSCPILPFFDSSTPDCLISGGSSASHFILIRMDESRELLPKVYSHDLYNRRDCATIRYYETYFIELRDIHKTTFMTHLGYLEFLIISFGATTPINLSGFDEPRTPLASPSESRDLAMRD